MKFDCAAKMDGNKPPGKCLVNDLTDFVYELQGMQHIEFRISVALCIGCRGDFGL